MKRLTQQGVFEYVALPCLNGLNACWDYFRNDTIEVTVYIYKSTTNPLNSLHLHFPSFLDTEIAPLIAIISLLQRVTYR